jgi:hypothetical protein
MPTTTFCSAARTILVVPALSHADSCLTAVRVKAAHFQEFRDGTK